MRGINTNGPRIRKLRKAAGLTQEALAKRAGCDVKTIRKAEQGGRLDLVTLHNIAAALHVNSSDLAIGSGDSLGKEEINLNTVHTWLDAFNNRDVEAIIACWNDDGVLRIPGADEIPSGGTFSGKDGIRAHTETTFQIFDTEHITREMLQISAVEDCVFIRGEASVVHIPTGREIRCYVVHEFRFSGGKISEMIITTDTQAFHRMIAEDNSNDATAT